ncbi:MAG: RAD55 family ATPase [Promethearchaeota archaeon]
MQTQTHEIKRTKTGISGLDEALNGGMPEKTICVVSGGPGCGKTMLSCEYLYKGATLFNEPGVYISLGETREEFLSNALNFGWDFAALEKKSMFGFVNLGYESLVNFWIQPSIPPDEYDCDFGNEQERPGEIGLSNPLTEEGSYYAIYQNFINQAVEMIETIEAKRVVIDPINSLTLIFPSEFHRRREFLRIFNILKESKCTTLILSELADENSFTVEEFIATGVIRLTYKNKRDIMSRRLLIQKMRGTGFNEKILSMRITNKGIELMGETLGFD